MNKPYLLICKLFLLLLTMPVQAAQLIENGDFETPEFLPWEDISSLEAGIERVANGDCFATMDTRNLGIRGQYSARLFNTSAHRTSRAALRSGSFIAGEAIAFIALTALPEPLDQSAAPVFEVSILDADSGMILVSQTFIPQYVYLNEGCPSNAVSGRFSSHYFSTRPYSGQSIKIIFSQSPGGDDTRAFTLIDQVILFGEQERSNFFSQPHAQAGSAITVNSTPYLTAQGSFDPDNAPQALRYSWWINNHQYPGKHPCLTMLAPGNQQAILYVNDGHHAVSDTISFYMPPLSMVNASVIEGVCDPVPVTEPLPNTSLTIVETANARKPVKSVLPSSKNDTLLSLKVVAPPALTAVVSSPSKNSLAPTAQTSPITTVAEHNQQPDHTQRDIYAQTEVIDAVSIAEEDRPLNEFTRKAYPLSDSGIHWIPKSDADSTLLVETPEYFPEQVVKLLDENRQLLETAQYDGRPDKRARYRFTQAGEAYPAYLVLRIGNTDYLVRQPEQIQP